MKKLDRKGFTLIEIMIVCAIIALLVFIAIPSYVNSRTTSARNVCISNLRQMDSAIQMYYIENESWPTEFSDLLSYLQNILVMCPADNSALSLEAGFTSCPNHGNLRE